MCCKGVKYMYKVKTTKLLIEFNIIRTFRFLEQPPSSPAHSSLSPRRFMHEGYKLDLNDKRAGCRTSILSTIILLAKLFTTKCKLYCRNCLKSTVRLAPLKNAVLQGLRKTYRAILTILLENRLLTVVPMISKIFGINYSVVYEVHTAYFYW